MEIQAKKFVVGETTTYAICISTSVFGARVEAMCFSETLNIQGIRWTFEKSAWDLGETCVLVLSEK